MNDKLDRLFYAIRNDCLDLIEKKKVDVEELSFKLGCNLETLVNLLNDRDEDFSIYLKLYDILLEW